MSVWWPVGVDGWIFQFQSTDENITRSMQQTPFCRHLETLRWEWRNMSSKATFSTYTWRLSPLHFRMRFWSWKSGRFWLMSSFYQKQQAFLLDKVRPIRGREDLLSFWPRAQRNGTSQFKLQEAYRTLLMLFSLCRDSSVPARLAAKKF